MNEREEVHVQPILDTDHCNEDACSYATHWEASPSEVGAPGCCSRMALTEFLLARIAEDDDGWPDFGVPDAATLTEHLFRQYAETYADHPDYRQEWKP